MNYSDVYTQITTLPPTYLRPGQTFAGLMSSFAYGVSRFTESVDFMMQSNSSLATMDALWLEMVGNIVSVPRNNNVTTSQYLTQIQTIVAEVQGTPVSLVRFLSLQNISVTYSDKFSGPGDFSTIGYNLAFETPVSNYDQIALSLKRVRPAGVPFTFSTISGGLYLNTINYIGGYDVTGYYLLSPFNNIPFTIPETTNNAFVNLPTRYLTDPYVNVL